MAAFVDARPNGQSMHPESVKIFQTVVPRPGSVGAPSSAPKGPRTGYALKNMDEIAQTAQSMLEHIETNLEDR